MGRNKQKKNALVNEVSKKLSPVKQHELNQLIDKVLQIGFTHAQNPNEQWTHYVEIKSALDRIIVIESTAKNRIINSQNRFLLLEKFLDWAQINKINSNGLTIDNFSGYDFGLKATRDIVKGENVLTIPKRMMLTEETVKEKLNMLIDKIPMIDTMSNVKLAFALLLEKIDTESFWKPFINTLPEKPTTVLYYTCKEMLLLKGSNSFNSALNQCKNIARQYAFIYRRLQNIQVVITNEDESVRSFFKELSEKFSYELYRWCISNVMTRQNSVPNLITTENNTVETNFIQALIPFWDMANHMDGEITTTFNHQKEQLESYSMTNFAKGEQYLIYYGPRSNADFLIHNGFIYPEHKTDYVCIKLGLSASDELIKERNNFFDILNIPKNFDLKIHKTPNYLSPQILAFVRIFNMNREQLDYWSKSENFCDLLSYDCKLEPSLELKSWTFLETRLTLLLKAFPTTIEEDEKMLTNHTKGQIKFGYIKAMLIQYRLIEKKILNDACNYVKQKRIEMCL